ncbi:MAG: HNH endonuclease [Chitinophagales bacterium]
MQCTYCGSSRNIQNDHIRPQVRGGVTTTPACAACNQSKGAKSLLQWLRWTKEHKSYRWNKIKNYHQGKSGKISNMVQKVRDE